MKILCDFDGVLTEQTEEALRVRDIFRGELARLAKSDSRVDQLLEQAESEMARHPSRHGWFSRNRITAFANEDLFIRVNGLGACLDRRREERGSAAVELGELLAREGHAGFSALAQAAYLQMVRETEAGKLKPVDPAVSGVLDRLLRDGHRFVVVSNSGTARIIQLFNGLGIKAADHERDPQAALRIRGGARKFELGEQSRGIQVGEYFVDVDRPRYEDILREERPDVVVGDVFSLDLALPYTLMKEGRLLLRLRNYTPAWVRSFCLEQKNRGPSLRCIEQIEELGF